MIVGKGLPTANLINGSLTGSRPKKEHDPGPLSGHANMRQQSFTSSWGRPCVRQGCLSQQGSQVDISPEGRETLVTVHCSPIYQQKTAILPPPFSGMFEITLLF